MDTNHKCSSKEHNEIDAIIFYNTCKIYMCNKCEVFHSNLFINHQQFNLDKEIKEIFTGICTEENHTEKLKYFCKDHNKLCCALCLCKLKGKGNGQHSDCDTCYIEDIKEEKKINLKKNLNLLEQFYEDYEKIINEYNIIIENINKKRRFKAKNTNNFY